MKSRKIGLLLGDSRDAGSDKTIRQTNQYLTALCGPNWFWVNGGVGGNTAAQGRTRWTNQFRNKFQDAYESVLVWMLDVNTLGAGSVTDNATALAAATSAYADAVSTINEATGDGWKCIICTGSPCNNYSGWASYKLVGQKTDADSYYNKVMATAIANCYILDTYLLFQDQITANILAAGGATGTTTIGSTVIARRNYDTPSASGSTDHLHYNDNAHEDRATAIWATLRLNGVL
ncbi:MAG: hypothetical protein AB7U73_01940 [Pirellulales bacterium]